MGCCAMTRDERPENPQKQKQQLPSPETTPAGDERSNDAWYGMKVAHRQDAACKVAGKTAVLLAAGQVPADGHQLLAQAQRRMCDEQF